MYHYPPQAHSMYPMTSGYRPHSRPRPLPPNNQGQPPPPPPSSSSDNTNKPESDQGGIPLAIRNEKGYPHLPPHGYGHIPFHEGYLPPTSSSSPHSSSSVHHGWPPANEQGYPPGYNPWYRHHGYPPPSDPALDQRERWRMSEMMTHQQQQQQQQQQQVLY